jgi:hypothetical protein
VIASFCVVLLQVEMANKNYEGKWILAAVVIALATSFFGTTAANVCLHRVEVQTVSVGQPVTLLCPGVSDPHVVWSFHDVHVAREKEIYYNGKVLNGNVGWFELDSSSDKVGGLKLLSSRKTDAGLYSCIENDGLGQRRFILLNVVGKCNI